MVFVEQMPRATAPPCFHDALIVYSTELRVASRAALDSSHLSRRRMQEAMAVETMVILSPPTVNATMCPVAAVR